MELLEKKIEVVKFLKVIRKMLKAGYREDWKYHDTYSGTPQGGIISPFTTGHFLSLNCNRESHRNGTIFVQHVLQQAQPQAGTPCGHSGRHGG